MLNRVKILENDHNQIQGVCANAQLHNQMICGNIRMPTIFEIDLKMHFVN